MGALNDNFTVLDGFSNITICFLKTVLDRSSPGGTTGCHCSGSGSCCGASLIPGPETSACLRCSQKKKKKKKTCLDKSRVHTSFPKKAAFTDLTVKTNNSIYRVEEPNVHSALFP